MPQPTRHEHIHLFHRPRKSQDIPVHDYQRCLRRNAAVYCSCLLEDLNSKVKKMTNSENKLFSISRLELTFIVCHDTLSQPCRPNCICNYYLDFCPGGSPLGAKVNAHLHADLAIIADEKIQWSSCLANEKANIYFCLCWCRSANPPHYKAHSLKSSRHHYSIQHAARSRLWNSRLEMS